MLHRLRQVNFVVNNLEAATGVYENYLGLRPVHSYRISDGRHGVLHAGDGTFVGLWHPDLGDAESAVFRESRGQGPYELVFETKALDPLVSHLSRCGVKVSGVADMGSWRSVLLDQATLNGARVRIVEVADDENPWLPAGPDWETLPPPGTLCLRQIAVLVRDLDRAVARWEEMFGLQATKRFEVSFTDLEIAVLPLAGRDTFIELAQPTGPDAPSQRFLDRYGEGLYLTIYEISDSLAMDNHLAEQGARFTSSRQTANLHQSGVQQHLAPPGGVHGGVYTAVPSVFARQSLATCRRRLVPELIPLSSDAPVGLRPAQGVFNSASPVGKGTI